MFKLLRFYSAASLLAVLATAALLTLLYRQVSIRSVSQLAEHNNVSLAQIALNPIRQDLVAFLEATADFRAGQPAPTLPPALAQSITALMHDHFVARIKIYNRNGVVVFSTRPGQIGRDQGSNAGFVTAMHGGVGNAIVYRDTFNSFDGVTEEDNLMQTYLPVRGGATEPIRGVFELYADVNPLVRSTERAGMVLLAGALLIMAALWGALLLIVHRASRIIDAQQRTIRDRTETLELLSAHMLRNEESHKQKVAVELHEGVAQTLAALKLFAENARADKAGTAVAAAPDTLVPVLHDAIQEVRAIATDLRPASLDDLGLLPTLNALGRDCEARFAPLKIEPRVYVAEPDIPAPLKIILYRIIAAVFADLAPRTPSGRIHVLLTQHEQTLVLMLAEREVPALQRPQDALTGEKPRDRPGIDRMEELATLSGGAFSASTSADGAVVLRAAWSR